MAWNVYGESPINNHILFAHKGRWGTFDEVIAWNWQDLKIEEWLGRLYGYCISFVLNLLDVVC